MTEHVFKVVELVGSSKESVSDAIQGAITRASKTIRNLRWFEVVQVRGGIAEGTISAIPSDAKSRLHPRRRLARQSAH